METQDFKNTVQRLRDLTDRVVIVTGGGQGIGRVYTKGLAVAGAIPVIVDLDGDKAASVAKEVQALGGKAISIQADVSRPESVSAMTEKTLKILGRIDGIVNNAAIFSTLKMRPFEEIPLDEWQRVINVNITGVMLCCKAVMPAMKAAGFGRIINISSSAITLGRPDYLHYTTSKAGIVGLTRSMAREVGQHGITVNAILPGATFTEIPRETVTPAQKQGLIAMQCIKRPQAAEDLLGTILFLASDAAAFLTGQSIAVDGGATHL
ncbi:SDR family NAD(P)-dependent oxidoreductase [Acidocella facilis]|uniref:SDR family NAD(P)-dependent oxidoreductase n=1 Tax=Acidocella facilis TaxID=525 RepID=UPI001F3718C8|nr:SDR family oxidoreductase [Acidocella facilis]